MAFNVVYFALLTCFFSVGLGQSDAISAQCHEDRPRAGTPLTADGLAKIVESVIGGPNDDVQQVCAGGFPPPPGDTSVTFNKVFYNFKITRDSNQTPLTNCRGSFQAITDKCIKSGNFWGGNVTVGGEFYEAFNSIFPNDPFIGDPVLRRVVSTEIGGTTITATFAPTQVPSLSSITETTVSTTTINNTPFPFVILPFGIIWAPVGPPLPTPVGPPSDPPPYGPDGPETTGTEGTITGASSTAQSTSPSVTSSSAASTGTGPSTCGGLSTLTDSPWVFDDNGIAGKNPSFTFVTSSSSSTSTTSTTSSTTETTATASPTATCMFRPPQPGSGSSQITVQFQDASPDQILNFQQKVGCAVGPVAICALSPENCSASPPDLVGITTISYLQSGGGSTLPPVRCAEVAIESAIGLGVQCSKGPQ